MRGRCRGSREEDYAWRAGRIRGDLRPRHLRVWQVDLRECVTVRYSLAASGSFRRDSVRELDRCALLPS